VPCVLTPPQQEVHGPQAQVQPKSGQRHHGLWCTGSRHQQGQGAGVGVGAGEGGGGVRS
jgi:hypothetical protein